LIDTVTFDFWQTLVADTPENLEKGKQLRGEGIGAVLAEAGAPVPPALLEAAHSASDHALVERWRDHRDAPIREQVRGFLDLVSPGLGSRLAGEWFDEVVEAYVSPVLRLLPQPLPGAVQAVTTLAESGLTLCVICNTGRTPGVILRRVLDHYGLLSHFSVLTFSDEVGYRKPHPEIFLGTLRQAGSDPRRAVHVGDTAESDVVGAKAVGMRAIHYVSDGREPSRAADVILRDLAQLPDVLSRLP
jgi:putative hydrolase of the HAD superfamily